MNQVFGQVREISKCEMFDLSVFAKSVPQQMGDVGLALVLFCDRGDVDGSFIGVHAPCLSPLRQERNT